MLREKQKQTWIEPDPDENCGNMETTCTDMAATRTDIQTTGTQTVLTVNEMERLVRSEAVRNKEMEKQQLRCVELEQDNTRLRAEKELRAKITELNEDFLKADNEKVRAHKLEFAVNCDSVCSAFHKHLQTMHIACISACHIDPHEASSRTFWTRLSV